MTDYISRAEAMSKCKNAENELIDEAERKGVRAARFIIGELPSADRPSGEWQQVEVIDDDEPSGVNTDASKCSVCGVIQQSHYWATHYYNYCPSCGARMKGGAE